MKKDVKNDAKNDIKHKLDLWKSGKRGVLTAVIAAVAIMAVVMAIFRRGYLSAAEKYEGIVKELEEEVEKHSDPIIVYEEASREVDIRLINAQIQDIGELATVEYLYTDAGKFEDAAELFGREIPFSFTTKSFIVKWDGSIKAGVDISEVRAEISEETREIVVYMPKAEILTHEIMAGSVETLDEKNGWFNRISMEDIKEFGAVSKEAMERRAVENGLLDKAFENAKGIIGGLIEAGEVEELGYGVRFEVVEEEG